MTAALLGRELRRLAPYGLGVAVLVVIAHAIIRDSNDVLAFGSFAVAAGLLGIATISPDTSAGGIAFLARMPIRPGRVLATKVLAALLWLTPSLAITAAFDVWEAWSFAVGTGSDPTAGLRLPYDRLVLTQAALPLAMAAFAAGLLASVLGRKTILACILAPIVGLAFVFAGMLFALGVLDIHVGDSAVWPLAGTCAVSFLGAAVVSFVRGDVHRASARPVVLGLSVLLAAIVASFGLAAAAQARTNANALEDLPVEPGVVSPDGRLVALPLEGSEWTGSETRIAVFDRTKRETWLVPLRNVGHPSFSPDGGRLLLSSTRTGTPGGWLVDLSSRKAVWLPAPGEHRGEGFGFTHLVWTENGPILARSSGAELATFAPGPGARTVIHRLGGETVLFGVRGQKLLARKDSGLTLVGLDGSCAPVPLTGICTGEALASPSGRFVLVRGWEGLTVVDLDHATQAALDLSGLGDEPAATLDRAASFDPGEERLAVELRSGKTAFFSVAGRRLACLAAVANERLLHWAPSWSPDGRLAGTRLGGVIDVVSGRVLASGDPVGVFAGDDALIPRRGVFRIQHVGR